MQRTVQRQHAVEEFGLFYPSYMCPEPVLCIRATGKIPRIRIKGPRECESKAAKDIITPPSEPVNYPAKENYILTKQPRIDLKDDELGIISINDLDTSLSGWHFLSSAEWKAELDRTPIGPCQPIPDDPTSWVHMSMREIEDEFWKETLDFDDYQAVIDVLQDTLEGRAGVMEPQRAVFLLDTNHVPLVTSKVLLEKLHQFYLDNEVRNVLKVCGVLILGSVNFHCIAVLFGAPFITSVAETFHFALLLTTTTVLPSLCVLGINFSTWVRVYAQNCPDVGAESILYYSSIGSVLGAWLGALPIPLDWDRPWQVWPITCVLGNLGGYLLGVCAGNVQLYLHYHRSRKFKLT